MRTARFRPLKLAGLFALGALMTCVVAWSLAIVQPPWRSGGQTSRLVGYQDHIESVLRDRLEFQEQFPQVLRRSLHQVTSGLGWRRDLWYGDSAMGTGLELEVRRLSAGWPLPALAGEHRWVRLAASQEHGYVAAFGPATPDPSAQGAPATFAFLPVLPLAAGFLVDTLLFAAVMWAMYELLAMLRRRRRRRAGCCARCGYPAGPSPECSECGWLDTGHRTRTGATMA